MLKRSSLIILAISLLLTAFNGYVFFRSFALLIELQNAGEQLETDIEEMAYLLSKYQQEIRPTIEATLDKRPFRLEAEGKNDK
jgi:hypothetical protein